MSLERQQGRCRMCLTDAPIRNVDLYVWGSEGLNVCQECELIIINFIRSISNWHIGKNMEAKKRARQ